MSTKETKKPDKKKGFFGKIIENLDKKLEEKSKKSSCCSPKKDKGSSCC